MPSEPDHLRVVSDGYDRLGGRYYAWTTANDPRYRLDYLNLLQNELGSCSRVLELGCGPGLPVAKALAEQHFFVGVDLSEGQLHLARRNAPGARLLRADIGTIDFAPASFDAIVAFYSVIHLPRDEHPRLIGHIVKWLRPGGFFVGNFGAHDNAGAYEDWIDGVPMYWSSFSADRTIELLREAGLRLVKHEVLANFEDGREAYFLWILARKR
jgi:SAM-dependent methyltransferase